jgi:hypothetical protein
VSLKSLGTKIYFWVFGPIYRRLSRDVSLRIQDLARVQVEFQERWSAVISDELIALSLKANSQANDLTDTRVYSPADIIETAGRIHKSQDLVALGRELEIPLNDLAQIYIKYSDVSASGVIRLMAMEEELKRMQDLHDKLQGESGQPKLTAPSSGSVPATATGDQSGKQQAFPEISQPAQVT